MKPSYKIILKSDGFYYLEGDPTTEEHKSTHVQTLIDYLDALNFSTGYFCEYEVQGVRA